jgi:hypothetical protein
MTAACPPLGHAEGTPTTTVDAGGVRREADAVRSRASSTAIPEVVERYLAVDDEGRGLRATWRPAHGFVNVSLWRGTTCVETFHLTPRDASELVAFLVGAFAAAVPQPARPKLQAVPRPDAPAPTRSSSQHGSALTRLRTGLAHALGRAAQSLRP